MSWEEEAWRAVVGLNCKIETQREREEFDCLLCDLCIYSHFCDESIKLCPGRELMLSNIIITLQLIISDYIGTSLPTMDCGASCGMWIVLEFRIQQQQES